MWDICSLIETADDPLDICIELAIEQTQKHKCPAVGLLMPKQYSNLTGKSPTWGPE